MVGSSPATLAHRRQNQQKRPPPRPAVCFARCHHHRRQREGKRKHRVLEPDELEVLAETHVKYSTSLCHYGSITPVRGRFATIVSDPLVLTVGPSAGFVLADIYRLAIYHRRHETPRSRNVARKRRDVGLGNPRRRQVLRLSDSQGTRSTISSPFSVRLRQTLPTAPKHGTPCTGPVKLGEARQGARAQRVHDHSQRLGRTARAQTALAAVLRRHEPRAFRYLTPRHDISPGDISAP